jgi:hypothetical protein
MKTSRLIGAVVIFYIMLPCNLFAQVSINSDSSQPDSSAMLEVKSVNKGFLPPRIALSSVNSSFPVTSPALGLLIFNTATAGTPPDNVSAGYYYWSGTKWIPLSLPVGTYAGQILTWNGTSWIPASFYINVLSFGADNTGVQDATTAIQNALNAVPAQGGTVFFPAGKYRTSGNLIISRKTNLLGENGGYTYDFPGRPYDSIGSVILCKSRTATLFIVNSPDCMFRDIMFMNNASSPPSSGTGIHLTYAGEFKMEDCSIVRFWNNMEITDGERWNITGTQFSGAVNYNLKIDSPLHADYGDNNISGCTFIAGTLGGVYTVSNLRYESSGGLKIINCKFFSDQPPINHIDAFIHGNTGQLMITNCSFEYFTGYGIHLYTSPGHSFGTFLVSNCQFAPYRIISGNCIAIGYYVSSVVINGNMFQDSPTVNSNPAIRADSVNMISIRSNIYPGWAKRILLTNCAQVDTLTTFGVIAPNFTLTASDTTVAVNGRSVFISNDSSYYDCRSTTSAHNWWKRKYE